MPQPAAGPYRRPKTPGRVWHAHWSIQCVTAPALHAAVHVPQPTAAVAAAVAESSSVHMPASVWALVAGAAVMRAPRQSHRAAAVAAGSSTWSVAEESIRVLVPASGATYLALLLLQATKACTAGAAGFAPCRMPQELQPVAPAGSGGSAQGRRQPPGPLWNRRCSVHVLEN
jgi:hypothetical protein